MCCLAGRVPLEHGHLEGERGGGEGRGGEEREWEGRGGEGRGGEGREGKGRGGEGRGGEGRGGEGRGGEGRGGEGRGGEGRGGEGRGGEGRGGERRGEMKMGGREEEWEGDHTNTYMFEVHTVPHKAVSGIYYALYHNLGNGKGIASFPDPTQLSVACSTSNGKLGEAW